MTIARAALESLQSRLGDTATAAGARRRTWRQVLDRCGRVAGGLVELGLRSEDRVAVLSRNSDAYLELYLAVAWAGGVLTPLNTRWSGEENAFALADSTPRVVILDDEALPLLAKLRSAAPGARFVHAGALPTPAEASTFANLLAGPPMPPAPGSSSQLYGLFYTGGTTGRPKGVMLSHGALLANSAAARSVGMFPDGARFLHVAPMFHMADATALIGVTMGGGCHVILPGFDAAATIRTIAEERVTDTLLVPTMIQMVIEHPQFRPEDWTTLARITYGASSISEAVLLRAIKALPNVAFFQAYGMTELGPIATVLRPADHTAEAVRLGRHKSAGKPLPGVRVKVRRPDGRPASTGEVGEISVRSPSLMSGYWLRKRETSDAIKRRWMYTGDGGYFDEDGYLHVVDRIKDMIITGGENVYSAEVENALATHPDVAQCAVVGVPDAQWGERVHAVIVPRSGAQIDMLSLTAHCRPLIAGYKRPRSMELRTELPISAAGKVLKTELRRDAAGR